jgi:hypothetical protein
MSHGGATPVVSAISMTGDLIAYFRSVKGFPKEHRQFLRELSSLQALLDEIQFFQDDEPSEKWCQGFQATVVNSGILENYNEAITALNEKAKPKGGMQRGIQKMGWSFTKEEIGNTLEKLERLKTVIQAALAADNM